jgi:hypothetical protein
MTDDQNVNGNLERLEQWAQKVLDDSARLPEDHSEAELRERQALWYADFFTTDDGWLVAPPDDPAMRERLTVEEGLSPELADEVLAKMRELAASR